MIEEAAGLGRFKRRRHRAELKLARVAVQVERARDLEAEVRGRLRPLALQATAAERAEKLAGEIAGLRVRIALLDLEAIEARLEDGTGRAVDAALVRRAAEEKLEALLAERGQAEQELADAAGGRESASAALYRLRTAGERVAMRRESVGGLSEALRAQSAPLEPVDGPSPAELERAARATAEAARPPRRSTTRWPSGRGSRRAARGARALARRARGDSAGGARVRRGRRPARPRRARRRAGPRARGRRGARPPGLRAPRDRSGRRPGADRACARGRARQPRRRHLAGRAARGVHARRAGRAADADGACGDPRRDRLRPRARRALVRGRDGGGGAARARRAP